MRRTTSTDRSGSAADLPGDLKGPVADLPGSPADQEPVVLRSYLEAGGSDVLASRVFTCITGDSIDPDDMRRARATILKRHLRKC